MRSKADTGQATSTVSCLRVSSGSAETVHNERDAAGQQTPAGDRDRKRQQRLGTARRMRFVQEIPNASLHHQHRQGCERSHAEPPDESPHTPSSFAERSRPASHSAPGLHTANLAHRSGPVKEQGKTDGSPAVPETATGESEADQDAYGTRGGAIDFRPRCKKIEMLPAPLFAVTSPGSSVSFVLRVRVATANGPPFVR